MWWRRRRQRDQRSGSGPEPVWRTPDRSPAPGPQRLRVDGLRVRVNPSYSGFADDARGGLALLRTDFVTVGALADANPLTRLFRAGIAEDPVDLCTLCCLRCHARHALGPMMARTQTGREPVRECLRCASPDALLVYDPDAAGKAGEPYDLRSDDAAGLRVERVTILARTSDLPPATIRSALDLADHGEDARGAHVEVQAMRPGDSPAEAEGLAQALVYRREREGAVSPDALSRTRWVWLRMPEHGDLLVVVTAAPG